MHSSDVFISPQVAAVKAIHQHTIDARLQIATVRDFLYQMAQNLMVAYQAKKTAAVIEINNYHPDYLGKPESEIRQKELVEADFMHTIANEYGFTNWVQVEKEGQIPIDQDFEKAVDLLLAGKKAELEALLEEKPHLISAHSSFGHKVLLIHYVGSNGVELWRQVVPLNLAEITQMLIKKGADKQAMANVYGGSSLAGLVSTSSHPWEAGVAEAVLDLL